MFKASLGYQGGSIISYPDESKEEFEKRCYRIALFALPNELVIEKKELNLTK